MVLIPCEKSDFFYDGSGLTNADGDPMIGLGYICEAKIIPTILSGKICRFPFVYNNKIYDSCSFEPIPDFNPDGLPWCALEVDENENVQGLFTLALIFVYKINVTVCLHFRRPMGIV